MSLFEFLLPEQAEAVHLRNISSSISHMSSTSQNLSIDNQAIKADLIEMRNRINELENDRNELILLLLSMFRYLGETSDFTIEKIKDYMKEIDQIDGKENGAIDRESISNAFGLFKPKDQPKDDIDPNSCSNCGRPILKSLNKCLYCGGLPNS